MEMYNNPSFLLLCYLTFGESSFFERLKLILEKFQFKDARSFLLAKRVTIIKKFYALRNKRFKNFKLKFNLLNNVANFNVNAFFKNQILAT